MGAAIDLTNMQFGRLTAIEKTDKRKNKSVVWKCRCECGTICEADAGTLRALRKLSCGCLKQEKDKMPKGNVIDLIGQTFHHLTVIERDGSDKRGEAKWLCECDCEAKTRLSVLGSNLRTGHTTSCGCERRSHGEIKVATILNEHQIDFKQEVPMFQFANGKYAKFDFYVEDRYLIEYDGETHYHSNLHGWHSPEQLEAQQERDILKNQWCEDNHIPLIRIPYWHLNDLDIEDLLLETSSFVVGG